MAADCPATITLGRPFSLPKFGSLSPAQQAGNACVPVKPLRANTIPSFPKHARNRLQVFHAIAIPHLPTVAPVGVSETMGNVFACRRRVDIPGCRRIGQGLAIIGFEPSNCRLFLAGLSRDFTVVYQPGELIG